MTPSLPRTPRSDQSGDESPHSTRAARHAWLDLFRGACVLGMIETHVLNTFLIASSRETAWFAWLTYFDGLIAPAFLFIAGYAQGLGMRRSGDGRDTLRRVVDRKGGGGAEPNPPRPPAEVGDTTERVPPGAGSRSQRAWGRKLRRLVQVWLLGYALHFPAPQLFAGQWAEALRLGTVVDVLQCIAISLALLLAVERFARRWADVCALLGLLLAVVVLREEIVTTWRFGPQWLLGYFNRSTGSLFPLIPWAGFVFAGFLASAPRSFAAKAGAFVVAMLLGCSVPGSVGFFFERLAWLLAAVPLVKWIAARWQSAALAFAGRESLVIYATHLLLLEALAVTLLPRASFGVPVCAAIFLGVTLASFAIAFLWMRRRA